MGLSFALWSEIVEILSQTRDSERQITIADLSMGAPHNFLPLSHVQNIAYPPFACRFLRRRGAALAHHTPVLFEIVHPSRERNTSKIPVSAWRGEASARQRTGALSLSLIRHFTAGARPNTLTQRVDNEPALHPKRRSVRTENAHHSAWSAHAAAAG